MPKRASRRRRADRGRQADQLLLEQRLSALGLGGVRAVEVHENRTVLVSVGRRGIVRVHRGYAYATDRVLRAVVRFIRPASRTEQREAERVLSAFPVERYVPPRPGRPRAERLRPGDRRLLAELARRHRVLNERWFDGRLGAVQFRLSSKMRTLLGELTIAPNGRRRFEIAISRRHLECDGWIEVEHTLLHEMIHQWQVESGRALDHGATFRLKAKQLGVSPTAERVVQAARRAARTS